MFREKTWAFLVSLKSKETKVLLLASAQLCAKILGQEHRRTEMEGQYWEVQRWEESMQRKENYNVTV